MFLVVTENSWFYKREKE